MTVQEQFQLGFTLHKSGKLTDAAAHYRAVLQHQPDHPDALHMLGILAMQSGNPQAAADLFAKAIALQPNRAAYHANAALALLQLNRTDEAVAHLERALELDPNHADAAYNLGNASLLVARRHIGASSTEGLERAAEYFRRAIALRPDWREPLNNLGHTLCRLGRFDEAEEAYRTAVARRPDCASSHFGYAVMLLRNGDFERGWPEYEWRLRAMELGVGALNVPMPRWDGSDLRGKSILLCAEQGLGDTIFFSRFVPLLEQRGGLVTVAVQPDLVALMRSIGGAARWIALGEQVNLCDFYCPLPSLPGVLRTNISTIPAGVPYLVADAQRREKWRARMPAGRLKVGLVWAGQSQQHIDRERSLLLEQLAPLAQSGAWFVSLQKGEAARQTASSAFAIADWMAELADFSDTAALADNLDLIISVDTAVAHLAGAMGKPVWLLVPLVPDWRWMLERSDSPWYPTMRLFRQDVLGDWEAPVSRMAAALRGL